LCEMLGEGGHRWSLGGGRQRRAGRGSGSGKPTRQSGRIEAEAEAGGKWGRGWAADATSRPALHPNCDLLRPPTQAGVVGFASPTRERQIGT
jgi:hypothetical protein